MTEPRKIFIGSSSEALEMARLVGEEIEKAGMVPVVWDTIFPAGDIFLEVIERLPSEVDGAVLLTTPDVFCEREEISFEAPVANVVFEYGYLAARLTRKRVAICEFKDAILPSDLKGMTVVRAGDYQKYDTLPLPDDATRNLRSWLERLPPLAAGIPPITQVHGYAGRWKVQNRFALWHGMELGESNTVYFDGTTFLLLPVDGENGSGTQIGNLYIRLDHYRAKYEIVNQVLDAVVDLEGTLKMHVNVLRRRRIEEDGEPPDARYREDLANTEFDLVLKRVPGESKRLQGTHEYRVAGRVYSKSEENYQHLGL